MQKQLRSTAKNILWAAAAIGVLTSANARAQQTQPLSDLSIQDLLNVEVTTVGRKAQELTDTAAAVYVITRDDIRRSGASTLPDVLRMAPGFSVAELSANTWSVTSRGFGGVHANKLLVMIDGRSIYTTLTGGVNWEMQMLPLDAIEQIEIIRGPGGSIWGANAINGVINIITKAPDRTQGGRLDSHVGRYEAGNVEFGYGGAIGGTAHYVARGRFFQRRALGLTQGLSHGDDLQAFYARNRVDWGSGVDKFSFQADAERGDGRQVQSALVFSPPYRVPSRTPVSFTGGNTMISWKRTSSSRVDTSLQAYYSGVLRSEVGEHSHVIDLDLRHHRAIGARHDLVFGGEYRYSDSAVHTNAASTVTITPADLDVSAGTAFLQDEVALGERVRLTAGAKLEATQSTGAEVQPSIRALWNLSRRSSAWAAVSRAVRTPSRYERGMHAIVSLAPGPGALPLAVTLDGSADTTSESLVEYEGGYRFQFQNYSADLTGFFGEYHDLASFNQGVPGVGIELGNPVFRIPLTMASAAHAHTRGFETAATWKPAGWWEIAGQYSLTDVDFLAGSEGAKAVPVNGPVPAQQFNLRSFMDLPHKLEASALFYQASAVPDINVRAFTRLDLQMSWAPSQTVRFSGGVRSLLHDVAPEYLDATSYAVATPVRPNPYAELRWWF